MEEEYGLVLAGGGTKGAYEIGVWKAIMELNLKIKAISGTSIGALNGALILQNDFEKMEELYNNIQITDIISTNKKLDENKNIFNIKNISKLAAEYISNGGLENDALRKTAEKYVDVEKIYKSDIDFGMITFSVKDRKPKEVFKKDIKKEEMIDYLLASACFPIFKAQKIEDKEYFDGGLYDNMPINLLIKKGCKNIIVVDVTGIGIKRKNIDTNVYIKMIRANEDLGVTFEFNHEKISKNITLGYLDTMKSFNKMQGHIYYFKTAEFNKMLNRFNLQTIYGLESAAQLYKMDKYKAYNFDEFIKELTQRHKESNERYEKIKERLDFTKIITQRKEVIKMIDKGLGICLLMDLLSQQPSIRNFKIIKKMFSEYLIATDAMIELMNFYSI